MLEEAKQLVEAGIFSLVLEAIPWEVAKMITEALTVPTIGIGAGPHCDGQVLVTYDMLGYFDFKAKFVKRYLKIKKLKKARSTYLRGILRETVDGFIHPFFNLNLVITYRSSSDHPNFQNIPVRNAEIKKPLRYVIARPFELASLWRERGGQVI